MSEIKVSENNGLICKFEPEYHRYLCEDIRLASVTTVVKRYFPVFDTEGISRRYALKHGLSQDHVKKMWKDKGIKSATHGTNCHAFAEAICLKEKPYPKPKTTKEALHFKHIYNYIKKLATKYQLVDVESIFFSLQLQLAGMLDLILLDKENRRLILADWKTNEKIVKNNPYQTGINGFEHLSDCNLNHYHLQLNMYKGLLIFEEFYKDLGIKEENIIMVLLHVTDNGVVYYKVPDLTNEVKHIFQNQMG